MSLILLFKRHAADRPAATRGRTAALLLAVALLAAQTVAVLHAHADGAPEAPCAVCPLVGAQTAACDSGPAIAPIPAAGPVGADGAPCRAGSAAPPRYRCRAPPAR